jgi:hypothetical protein
MSGEQISNSLDTLLLDILKNGREVVTKSGEVIRVQATAADLNVARQRLKDCGISVEATDTNPIGNIIEEMQLRGMNMDDIDTESDDVATGT